MGQRSGDASKSPHHHADMLHLRRSREAMAHQLAPFSEIRRSTKINSVVLDRCPLDEQPVARGLLDRALQCQTSAALGASEHRGSLRHTRLELCFHAGLNFDLGDFENHDYSPLRSWAGKVPSVSGSHCETKARGTDEGL